MTDPLREPGAQRFQFLVDRSEPAGWLVADPDTVTSGRGSLDVPTLVISVPRDVAKGSLLKSFVCGGLDLARHVEVAIPGGAWALHPPFDVDPADQPLPKISYADVVIRFDVTQSALGHLVFDEAFTEGQLISRLQADSEREADLTVKCTFRQLVTGYDPALDSLTAVTGMRIDTRHRALVMVAAGLYDDRSLRSFLNARHRENLLLADLSDALNRLSVQGLGA